MAISMNIINIGTRDIANQTMLIISLLNLVYCGRQFYATAWRQLIHGSASMDYAGGPLHCRFLPFQRH